MTHNERWQTDYLFINNKRFCVDYLSLHPRQLQVNHLILENTPFRLNYIPFSFISSVTDWTEIMEVFTSPDFIHMVSCLCKNESYQIKKHCTDKLWAMTIISLMQLPSTLIILMMVQSPDNHIPQGSYTVNPHSCRVLSRLILLIPVSVKTT